MNTTATPTLVDITMARTATGKHHAFPHRAENDLALDDATALCGRTINLGATGGSTSYFPSDTATMAQQDLEMHRRGQQTYGCLQCARRVADLKELD